MTRLTPPDGLPSLGAVAGTTGASDRLVALGRRAIAWLVAVSLLALCVGQPFHTGPAPAAGGGSQLCAASAESGPASLPHDGAHLTGVCSLCRALAQTRVGLRSPAPGASGAPDASGLPLPVATLDRPRTAAPRASIEPRAPPGAPAPETA